MGYERLTIVLSEQEMKRLREIAQVELRRPKDQARALLRLGLGLAVATTQTENHNRAVTVLGGTDGAVVAATVN